jgi:membrane protease YdiL (CAAX protease family)
LVALAGLAVSYPYFPPSTPGRRVARALFLIAVIAVSQYGFLGQAGAMQLALIAPEWSHGLRAAIAVLALLLADGVLIGWLALRYLEGRTLREMGWVRRGWVGYALLGLVAGLILGLLRPQAPGFESLERDLGVAGTMNLATLAALPPVFLLVTGLLGLVTGWVEENLFRGHLLAALQERGLSGARANLLQAAVFALYHPVVLGLALRAQGSHTPANQRPGQPLFVVSVLSMLVVLFGMGLVFGLLRIRTRSVVLPFCLHSAYDAAAFIVAFGPLVALMAQLTKI